MSSTDDEEDKNMNATMHRKSAWLQAVMMFPRSGYTPWRTLHCAAMFCLMKQNSNFPKQSRNLSTALRPSMLAGSPLIEPALALSAEHVARKVGLRFMQQVLQPWREVQLWLAAEAELFAAHEFVPVRVRSVHHRHY